MKRKDFQMSWRSKILLKILLLGKLLTLTAMQILLRHLVLFGTDANPRIHQT
jgi:hypothetical protein